MTTDALAALVWKEWRILLRDRHGLAVLFLMPAVFILIMSLALRDAMPGGDARLEYLLLDEDRSYFALALGDALAGQASLRRLDSGAASFAQLQERVRAGEVEFAVRIAAGLTERIAAVSDAAKPAPLVDVVLAPAAPAQSRLLFLATVRAALAHVQSEYLLEDVMGVPHADAQRLREKSDPSRLALAEHYAGHGAAATVAPNAVQQSVPAWLVFAIFFVLLPIATSVIAERAQGTLQRLRLLNVAPGLLLGAKFFAYLPVNLLQMLLMLLVGRLLVPALGGERLELGASPLGLALIGSALSFAAVGFALLLAVIARTALQAMTLGGISCLLFGAVGGVMVPKTVMPPLMQQAALASPMSWALEGCWDILLRGGGALDALPEAAALCGFGVASWALAVMLFPRSDG